MNKNISEKTINAWRKEINEKFSYKSEIKFPKRESISFYDWENDLSVNPDFKEWELEMAIFRWGK